MTQSTESTLQFMRTFGIEGNIIDHSWYKIIRWQFSDKNPEGKPHREAIELLAHIFYWYKPSEKKDGESAHFLKSKFKNDILQRSYSELEENLGLTKDESVSAIKTLESLGIAERVFRTVVINGNKVSNIMYLQFFPKVLKELMDRFFKKLPPSPFQKGTPPCSTPLPPLVEQPYTKTSTKTSTKNNNRNKVVVVFPILNELEISGAMKSKLSSQIDEEKAFKLVHRVKSWKGRGSDAIACNTILGQWESWEDTQSKEDSLEENTAYLRKLDDLDGRKIGDYKIEVSPSHIIFRHPRLDGAKNVQFKVSDKAFIFKAQSFLRKYN